MGFKFFKINFLNKKIAPNVQLYVNLINYFLIKLILMILIFLNC